MIELIKGQTISIDNHNRGNGQPIYFDPRIHIHKRMNKNKYAGIEVFLYLAIDKDIEIKKGKKQNMMRLESEMRRAFKDKEKRKNFVQSMLNELNRKCTYSTPEEKLKANLISAQNIAKQFGLHGCSLLKNDDTIFEMLFKDNEDNPYFLLQDFSNKTIRIGDSQDIVENWDSLFSK